MVQGIGKHTLMNTGASWFLEEVNACTKPQQSRTLLCTMSTDQNALNDCSAEAIMHVNPVHQL